MSEHAPSPDELKTENELLRRQLEEMKASVTAKEVFLSNMSHDIRTPMNAIVGMTVLAKKHIDEKGRVLDALSKIESASAHLLSLINDVLEMSQINSGRLSIASEPFSLGDLIHDTMVIMRPQIDAKGHSFTLDTSEISREYLIGDVLRLRQIYVNIMNNAVKYTRSGGDIRVRFSEKMDGDRCMLTFVCLDNGIGMNSEFLKRIYEPFERVNNSTVSGIEGTGLGMSIVFRIVQAMGGDIDIQSEPEKGTEVTITVPLSYEDVSADAKALEGKNVLIIGDREDITDRLDSYLCEIGVSHECVPDMTEALSLIARADVGKKRFDIVLMGDIGEGGNIVFDSASYLHRSFPDMVLVLCGEHNWEDVEYRARRSGIVSFLPVPFFRKSLIRVMTEALYADVSDTSSGYPDLSGRHILLVEDNLINREIAKEILSMTGAEIVCAEDGKEAVDTYLSRPERYFDIVLMDVQMPVMNGYEATKGIRGAGRSDSASVPIFAMTANTFAEDVAKARQAGMDGHIAKPIDINNLMQILRSSIKSTTHD